MKRLALTALISGLVITGTEDLGAPNIPNIGMGNISSNFPLERRLTTTNPLFRATNILRQTTRSQIAVNAMINRDLEQFKKTGRGHYMGKPILYLDKFPETEEIMKKCEVIDCYDALRVVLGAELSPEEFKRTIRNSMDNDGNFSAPFTIKYLTDNKGWEVFGYCDEDLYKSLQKRRYILGKDRDVALGFDKSGIPYYLAGEVKFSLNGIVPSNLANTLLKELTLERGYGIGVKEGGTHCYTNTLEGMFETHSDAFPLGHSSTQGSRNPLELHRGVYYASNASIAVFAFPKRRPE